MSAIAGRAAVAVAAGLLVLAGLWGDDSSGQARAPRQTPGEVTLELTESAFAVPADTPWRAVFTVSGTVPGVVPPTTTTTAPTTTVPRRPRRPRATTPPATAPSAPAIDATVRVVLYRSLDERSELAEALDGDLPNEIDSIELPATDAIREDGGTTTLTVDAPTTVQPFADDALTMRVPGVYPIGVELRVGGEVVAEHVSFVERLATDPATTPPLNIAIVAATPDPGPDPTATELAAGRDDLAAIADVSARSAGPVSVAIPPVLVDGLSTQSGLGAELAAGLEGAELLPLPANQLDPSSAVAIDETEAFVEELREGEDLLAAALPSTPTRRSAWLVTEPISAAAAAELRNLGFRLLVLDTEVYEQLDGNIAAYQDPALAVDVDVGDGFAMPALVVHPSGRFLDPDYLRATGLTPREAAVRLLAELMTSEQELAAGERRSVVLATPGIGVPDPAVVEAFTALVADLPDARLAPLSSLAATTDTMLLSGEPVTVALPSEAGVDLSERADRIALTRLSVESAASMMVDDSPADGWREELDTLLSTGFDEATVDAALRRISSAAATVRDSVSAPGPFTFTLTGRESVLRLNIRNDADEPRRVIVRARSPKLTFPDGDHLVVLDPAGNTEVELRVVARSNGTSTVEVELLTPAFSQPVDGPVVLTARVNALSGLGQVITGGAVLVLLSWWFSHFRRKRRARLNGAAAAEAAATTSGAEPEVSPDAAEAVAAPPPERSDTAATSTVPDP